MGELGGLLLGLGKAPHRDQPVLREVCVSSPALPSLALRLWSGSDNGCLQSLATGHNRRRLDPVIHELLTSAV